MANKYKDFSKQAQAELKKFNMCSKKKAYNTEEEAYHEKQRAYLCPHCEKWHRTYTFRKMVDKTKRVKNKRKKKN